MRHFLTLNDFSKDEIIEILNLAFEIKKEAKARNFKPYLKDQKLAMIFEKSSTRTRVSFDVGMNELGGHALFLSSRDIQLGRGEPIKDTARVISRMCDLIMARVNRHETLIELAEFSRVPVINGLSDKFHPVQLMADLMTIVEHGIPIAKIKAAYVGAAGSAGAGVALAVGVGSADAVGVGVGSAAALVVTRKDGAVTGAPSTAMSGA